MNKVFIGGIGAVRDLYKTATTPGPENVAAAYKKIYPNVKYVNVLNSNYIQYVDKKGKLRHIQYDYRAKKWYEYKDTGNSIMPKEEFVKWLKL